MLLSSQNQFQKLVKCNDDKEYVAQYKDLSLKSVYQPIFDINTQVIGVEALVRITDASNNAIRPDLYFGADDVCLEDKINVERLSRVIHIRNFAYSTYRNKQLFLNVLPSAGEFFAIEDIRFSLLNKRLKALNLKPSQIVMEVVELNARDESSLTKAMNRLSAGGFKIAVDDFGTKASNRARVEQIRPDILKIDRSLLLDYMDGSPQELTSGLVLAKKVGAKVVVEGIETKEQFEAMRELNIDFYQGYFLATPQSIELIKFDSVDAL